MSEDLQFEEIAKLICDDLSFSRPSFIGNGAFKKAYLTKNADDLSVALKIFDPNKCNLDRAEREIAAMQQCESPFIAKLYDWGVYRTNGSGSFLYVIEEYLSGGTLTDRLPALGHNISQVCDYGIALFQAVSYLREKLLVHRDIKPDNIMFRSNSEVPILVDFGLVRNLSGTSLTHTYLQQGPGTPLYASPEQLNNDKHMIDWRSDQFSIGIVLSFCLSGSHPYQNLGETQINAVGKVVARGSCSDAFCEMTEKLRCDFLRKMVAPWPIDRFASPELVIEELQKWKKEFSG